MEELEFLRHLNMVQVVEEVQVALVLMALVLQEEVEEAFADIYCAGNAAVARATLLMKRQRTGGDWWTMWFGLRVGVLLMLLHGVSHAGVQCHAMRRRG